MPAPTPDDLRVGAWAEVRDLLERQLAPLGRPALAALAPRPGERVLGLKPNKVVEEVTICRFSAVKESGEDATQLVLAER